MFELMDLLNIGMKVFYCPSTLAQEAQTPGNWLQFLVWKLNKAMKK